MPKFKDDKMSYKISDILIGLIFAGLLIGTGFMQADLKNKSQIFMLLFGLLTLGSLFAKQLFKTIIPFYILLGTMLYINIFILTNFIIDRISPGDGWVVDNIGERRRVMQMNWIWGVLAGLVLSPLAIILYHKKIKRNRVLEISLTTIFIILTAIIYIKHE
jgi:glucan phosphoethanolaminetransferase (alkaline phosphatase superfamily)